MKTGKCGRVSLRVIACHWVLLSAFCGCSGEPTRLGEHTARVETRLSKSGGGINGQDDFCGSAQADQCAAGEGDCDSDAECQPGLVCATDVGADYGFTA
ncbi:MAG: hypothetical protein JW940_27055, partial [Polyangiaceae bacterium]|nr:hypothetical protein [Polyangiaceae bacterium]